MKSACSIIVSILLIIAVLLLLTMINNNNQIATFDNVNKPGFADESDPYKYPFILNNFISKEYCDKIIEASVNRLINSEVVGGRISSVRNSQQCWISKNDPFVSQMFETVSKIFGIPIENAEDLQVVRYLPGQYYNEHHDSCCDDNDKCREFITRGGQRKLTVLIYLNNDFGEGHTYFKNLNMKIKPMSGDAIVFYPLADNSCKCHPLALHAGTNVTSGEKWVANLWFREGKFN